MGSVNCVSAKAKLGEPDIPHRFASAPDDEARPPTHPPGFIAINILERLKPAAIVRERGGEMNDAFQQVPRVEGQVNGQLLKGLAAEHEIIEILDDDEAEYVAAAPVPSALRFGKPSLDQTELPAPPRPDLQAVALGQVSIPSGNPDPMRAASPPWEYYDLEDYNIADDFDFDPVNDFGDDDMLAQEMMADAPRGSLASGNQSFLTETSGNQQFQPPVPNLDTRIQCVDRVMAVFPGICRDYVSELYESVSPSPDHLIGHILDKLEKGTGYPNAKELQKTLKRKRDADEDDEAARMYGAADRIIVGHRPYM